MNLTGLNENQRKAVLSTNKAVRIIAGAGSGKTRVLTTRIAHLIEERHVYPNKILAITFTNKAANEMKQRIETILTNAAVPAWISTIHSACVRILREDIISMGYPRNFTVMDTDDQKVILKEAYKEFGMDQTTISYNSMLDYIANNKYAEVSAERAMVLAGGLRGETNKAKVYEFYLKRCEKLYSLDFDDLLLFTVRMFRQYPEILMKWQKRFSHILVDEFQDIDKTQYELILQLVGFNNEVYVVGDPDQTIYTWRGADVNIILNFENDFKGCETIFLNKNYRSCPSILNGANSLIRYNQNRVEKDLESTREDDQKITHYSSSSDEAEASWIASKIEQYHREGKRYRSCAILYRATYLSRALEKGLLDQRIPYIIYGGTKFYERAEIKDALCYLRMVVSGDDLAFNRIINRPKRGIGERSLDKIADAAKSQGISYYEAIKNEKILSGQAQRNCDELVRLVEKWKEEAKTLPLDRLLEKIMDESGYRKMLEDDAETDRLENLKELINDVSDFMKNYPDSSIDEYLQLVTLYTDKADLSDGDFVQLMTVHAAKGLEFDTVFVAGMSDGIFPNERAMAEGKRGLEEERRLAYVAFTRARNKLYITEAAGFSYVLSRSRMRSRFIDEIDESCIEHVMSNTEMKSKDLVINSELFARPQSFESRKEKAQVKTWKKGETVSHTVFGKGIVVKIDGQILHIAFSYPHGLKKILCSHPSIKKES